MVVFSWLRGPQKRKCSIGGKRRCRRQTLLLFADLNTLHKRHHLAERMAADHALEAHAAVRRAISFEVRRPAMPPVSVGSICNVWCSIRSNDNLLFEDRFADILEALPEGNCFNAAISSLPTCTRHDKVSRCKELLST